MEGSYGTSQCCDVAAPTLLKMPDMSYPVTKINQYGKRQHRCLKLTNEGIENIRPGGKVSSFHPYLNVLSVAMKNLLTFHLRYRDAKHTYVYKSEVAMQIVQEINTRLSTLKQSRVRVELTSTALDYQKKLQKEGAWTLDLEDIMMPPELWGGAYMDDLMVSGRSRGSMMGKSPGEKRNLRAMKLERLTGQSEEQRLAQVIDKMMLDSGGAVGKTVRSFVSNFAVLEKNPATLLPNVRQFMDSVRNYILDNHEEELSKLLVEANNQTQSATGLSLASAIETSIEKAVVLPFKSRLLSAIEAQRSPAELAWLEENLRYAKEQPQAFFGIKDECCSPSDWFGPIHELRLVNDLELPSEQLAAVLKAAKAVYSLVNYERNKGKDPLEVEMYFVSADDFFPIFIYVAAHCDLLCPLLLTEYLMGVCDPSLLSGEAGYYLTVLGSAFEYLKTLHEAPGEESAKASPTLVEEGGGTGTMTPDIFRHVPAWTVDLRGSFDISDGDDDSSVFDGGGCIFSDYGEDDANSSDSEAPRVASLGGGTPRVPPEPLLRSDKDVFSPLSQSEPVVPEKRLEAEPIEKRSHTGCGSADPRCIPARRAWAVTSTGRKRRSNVEIGSASFISSAPSLFSSESAESMTNARRGVISMEFAPLLDVKGVADERVFALEEVEEADQESGTGEDGMQPVVINFGALSYHADGETVVFGSVEDEV